MAIAKYSSRLKEDLENFSTTPKSKATSSALSNNYYYYFKNRVEI